MKRILLLAAVFAAATAAVAETITVATFNVWSGLTYEGILRAGEYEDRATRAFRFDLLAGELADLAPDVVALQEANPLPGYADRLAAELDLDAVHDVRQAGVRVGTVGLPANLREGDVILASRDRALAVTASRQLAGPGAGNVAAFQLSSGSQVLGAKVEAEGRTIHVFSTRWTPSPQADRERLVGLVDEYEAGRLPGEEFSRLVADAVAGAERRREEARETVVFINEHAGEEPVILMGSLHALPDSEEIRVLHEAGFVDVWAAVGDGPGFTWDAATNANIVEHGLAAYPGERARFDYVFVRGDGIVAKSASIILDRPTYGVHASDHYGVLAEIRVDP